MWFHFCWNSCTCWSSMHQWICTTYKRSSRKYYLHFGVHIELYTLMNAQGTVRLTLILYYNLFTAIKNLNVLHCIICNYVISMEFPGNSRKIVHQHPSFSDGYTLYCDKVNGHISRLFLHFPLGCISLHFLFRFGIFFITKLI